jgi:hypothetical protein
MRRDPSESGDPGTTALPEDGIPAGAREGGGAVTLIRHATLPGRVSLVPSLGAVADTALGVALAVADVGGGTLRRTRVVWSPLVVLARRTERAARRTPLAPAVAALTAQGALLRGRIVADAGEQLDHLLPAVVEAALRRVDLTKIVVDHVDLDRVVTEVDLDAVVRRVDVELVLDRVDVAAVVDRVDVDAVALKLDVARVLDRMDLTELALTRLDWDVLVAAVLAHVDLEAIALDVIESVDLPEIIRESTGALTSDTVRSARIRGAAADQALSRVRDRFRTRHNGAGVPAPDPPVRS